MEHDEAVARLLRQAVLAHVAGESRRVFAPVVHAGVPGIQERSFALGKQPLDHALRTDVVEALVHGAGQGATGAGAGGLVWLTRRGDLDVQDLDLAWAAAVRSAAGELARPLLFVVVNRRGWHEPDTGRSRTWQRLRPSRPSSRPGVDRLVGVHELAVLEQGRS